MLMEYIGTLLRIVELISARSLALEKVVKTSQRARRTTQPMKKHEMTFWGRSEIRSRQPLFLEVGTPKDL